ncbi:MAG: hypothetical protein GOU97_01135 [Nanoarchaeota archaeon]|nr:hypothetical protein [Nanoarchaeota archaeon]
MKYELPISKDNNSYEKSVEKPLFEKLSVFSGKKFGFLARKPVLSDEFVKSFDLLEWKFKPSGVIAFSRLTAILILISFSLASVFSETPVILFVIGLALALASIQLITEFPKDMARERVKTGLEFAPEVLTNIIVSLKQNPNLEEAFEFASKFSSGLFVKDVKKLLNSVLRGETSSLYDELPKLAYQWGEYSNGLKRAVYYISESFNESHEARRLGMLDKALEIVIKDSIQMTREFNSKLFVPALMLFSFGTILPLIIVSLLPLTSFFGASDLLLKIGSLLILSLVGVFLYSRKILKDRPPTFSIIKIPETVDMPKKGFMRIKIGKKVLDVKPWPYLLSLLVLVGFPGWVFLIGSAPQLGLTNNFFSFLVKELNTLTILWGVGLSICLWAYGTSYHKKGLRDKAKESEAEVIDASYQLSNKLAENRSPESAISFISKTMSNTSIGRLFGKAARALALQNLGLEEIFFGEKGLIKKIYSEKARSLITVFVKSTSKGNKNSSEIVFTSADFFSKINEADKELKNLLQKNLSMMQSTAMFFSPMICAMIVGLQKVITNTVSTAQKGLLSGGYAFVSIPFFQFIPINIGILQLIMGLYALTLSLILISFVSRIVWGDDEVMLKTDVAKASASAIMVFTLTLIITNFLI